MLAPPGRGVLAGKKAVVLGVDDADAMLQVMEYCHRSMELPDGVQAAESGLGGGSFSYSTG
jgi:hypothetical protein